MKSNTCLLWGCETFELCPNDLVINKKTPCDNLRNLRNPCSPLHPVVRKLFKVIILGSNLSKVLRGEGFVKLLDVDLIHIILCRSVRICGNRNRMIFQASKINRDELIEIRFPNPWFISDGELISWLLSTLCDCDVDRVLLGARPGHHGIDTPSIKWSSSSWLAIMIRDWFRSKWSPPQLPEQVFLLLNLLLRLCQRSLPLSCSLQLAHLDNMGDICLPASITSGKGFEDSL